MADLASLLDAARNRGLGAGFETALRAAYGPVDEAVLAAQLRVHALHGVVWRTHRDGDRKFRCDGAL